jgi:hypothetical protein
LDFFRINPGHLQVFFGDEHGYSYDFNQSFFMFGEGRPFTVVRMRGVSLSGRFGIPPFTWGDEIDLPDDWIP